MWWIMQSETFCFGGLPIGKGYQEPLVLYLFAVCVKQEELPCLDKTRACSLHVFLGRGNAPKPS